MSVPATLRGAYFWYIGNIRQALCTEPSAGKTVLAKRSKLATKWQHSKTLIVQARIVTTWTPDEIGASTKTLKRPRPSAIEPQCADGYSYQCWRWHVESKRRGSAGDGDGEGTLKVSGIEQLPRIGRRRKRIVMILRSDCAKVLRTEVETGPALQVTSSSQHHGCFSSQSFWKEGSPRKGSQIGSSLRRAGVTGVSM
jgi:hypothetical protein